MCGLRRSALRRAIRLTTVGTMSGEPVYTLAIDCGGTGLKGLVLNEHGEPVTGQVYVPTPYPCPPQRMIDTLVDIAERTGHAFDRVTVGFPGLIRHGVVYATPHYVTLAGPFTPADPDLVRQWSRFDVAAALGAALQRPTRVANDAEIAGLAVIQGRGFEVVLTFGTGMGFAYFDNGRLLPKIEMSQGLYRDGQTYDQYLGITTFQRIGAPAWVERIEQAVADLRPVWWWDRLYIGGGGSRHLHRSRLGHDVTVVPNIAGMLGGIKLWDSDGVR